MAKKKKAALIRKPITARRRALLVTAYVTGAQNLRKLAIVMDVPKADIFWLGAALEDSGFNVRREKDNKLVVHAGRVTE